ncbi:MAG: small basic protein [Planctomycetes bacterium]|nr:small basic protein [Planctomycetota bacterium]
MSIHPSLKGLDTLVGERSVFTRKERLMQLMKEGKVAAEGSVYGLPKVRTKFKLKAKKKTEDETDEK